MPGATFCQNYWGCANFLDGYFTTTDKIFTSLFSNFLKYPTQKPKNIDSCCLVLLASSLPPIQCMIQLQSFYITTSPSRMFYALDILFFSNFFFQLHSLKLYFEVSKKYLNFAPSLIYFLFESPQPFPNLVQAALKWIIYWQTDKWSWRLV